MQMFIDFMIVFAEENRCTSPLYVEYAKVSVYTSEFGTTLHMECVEGYRFRDGVRERDYQCLSTGKWEPLDACHGKLWFTLCDTFQYVWY